MWLVIVGICIHLVFFYSIFDIYFTSPLVHGMPTFATGIPAPAKRLVFFVADGLRADKFYEVDADGKSRAPYLRSIVNERGSWGVSHTRVPTESRPGHVALIAGFYEDVSAVAKGWKENPVEFDSIFNESRFTWSWGSPDILPMFAKGATGDHVVTHCYEAEMEDFAAKNLSQLDTWVFDQVKEFLSEVKSNSTVYEKLTQDKIVFFLHLLGLDTNGHSNKPYSDDYLDNIKVVDSGIREIEGLFEEFYGHDGKTAYVMTSDHGMTNWGSHGAGHPSETLTPLVVWGAGANLPQPARKDDPLYNDQLSQEWKLNDLRRIDVEQADVAALMAALIGIPFPVNNVGTVPIDYLSTSDYYKAESLYTNAKQMLSQYRVKQIERESTTLTSTFRPFKELSSSVETDMVRNIRTLLKAGRYQDAIHECRQLIELSLKGLNYYHNYNRLFLGASIVLGFLGWMAYILALALQEYSGLAKGHNVNRRMSAVFFVIFLIAGIVITSLLYVQHSPCIYYLYCLLPLPLWLAALSRLGVFVSVMQNIVSQKSFLANSMTVILTIAGLELIVLGFFVRELFSVGLLCMAGWIHSADMWKDNKPLCVQWICGCLLLAVFPLLPVVGGHPHYTLVLLGGCVFTWIGVTCIYRPQWLGVQGGGIRQGSNFFFTNIHLFLILAQVVCLAMSVFIVRSTSYSIAAKQGLPLVNQILSWTILCVSLVLPLVGSKHILSRLISIGMSLAAPYILLSTAHEPLFLLSLSVVLYIWLQLEFDLQTGPRPYQLEELDFGRSAIRLGTMTERNLSSTDLRRAYFFIFLVLTAFFGTGNIASINSFDPASVYSFLTVFHPFVMGALMLAKILIPFILVTCVFRAIHIITHLPTRAFFFIMMLLSDAMALNFFLLVRDHGSWLDIGTSISHYVIVMSMCIFLQLLLGIAHILTGWSIRRPRSHQF